jgi:hypothetical protein
MAQKNKLMPYIIFGVPLAIGLYFIIKSLKNKKGQDAPNDLPNDSNSSVDPTNNGGATPTVAKYFPMKRGSKGAKVEELQNAILSYDATLLPKYGADKDFGAETESAVKKLLGKTTIDSQEDINAILNLKKTQATQQAIAKVNADRKALASKLVDMKKKNPSLIWTSIQDTQVSESDMTSDGRVVNKKVKVFKRGDRLPISTIQSSSYDSMGYITYTIDNNKQYSFSPYGFELKNYSIGF